jgi:hypothetical protein
MSDEVLPRRTAVALHAAMTNKRALKDFEAAIAGFPETMVASLTYIARIAQPKSYVLKARLNFHGAGMGLVPKLFLSGDIVAETFALSDLDLCPADVINSALRGKVVTPQGEFAFAPNEMGGYATKFMPLHPEGIAQQSRVGVLQIRGTDQGGHWQNPLLDWSLRSADVPYDNVNELSIDFGMVAVDLRNNVVGETANIGVFATKDLDRSQITIGYRVLDKGIVAARGTISGATLDWIEEEARDVGRAEIAVPPASLVNCYARYRGITYHSGFIVDPSLAQNPRRVAYERFDPGLLELTDLLTTKDKKRARDLEPAVACLLWMLGFSPCYIGGIKVLQEGPDILAMTPEGHIIVVECTVGTLKADSKMPKLLSRAVAVREQFANSGQLHLRVLPVMVTSLTRDEIASETGDAATNGVFVITRDYFEEAINRTLIPPHADQLFVEAEQGLQALFDAGP